MQQSLSATPKALVLGSLTRVLLAVVRSLGRGGVQVHVAGDVSDPIVSRSRYLFKTHVLPPYQGPESAWIDALCDLIKRQHFDVVMPCTDWETLVCHNHRNELERHARLCLPNQEAFEILFSKEKTSAWARKVDVRTPREIMITTANQADQVFKTFSFPVVLKPRQTFQIDKPGCYQQVAKAYSEPEFHTHLTKLQQSGDVVVQENFIGKGIGVELLMNQGQPLLAFQHARVHEPLRGGPSSYRKSVCVSRELLDASLRILEPLNYTGVAMVEFKVNEQKNNWVFIEVNPRFWGSLPLTIAAGADFPLALFQLWVYNHTAFPQTYRKGVYCRNLSMDLFWLKANLFADRADPTLETRPLHKVVSETFLNVLTLRERFDYWAADDPGPGMVELGSLLRRVGRKILFRRKR